MYVRMYINHIGDDWQYHKIKRWNKEGLLDAQAWMDTGTDMHTQG